MEVYNGGLNPMLLLLLLFLFSFFLGLQLVDTVKGGENVENVQEVDNDTFNEVKRVDGDIFSIMKSNISQYFSAANGVYHVETNGRGLREEPFRIEPPDGVKRIMFVGDSYTFGWGVPVEKRYVDLVEEKMNSNLEGEYQTIAAAVPGWGMSDYQRYLFHRGIDYRPRVVVVAFNHNDIVSREEEIEMYNNVTEATPENTSIRTITEKVGRIKERRIRNTDLRNSEFMADMKNMTAVARKNGAEIIFYAYFTLPPDKEEVIENWASENNVAFVPAPRKFATLPYTYYSLSQQDRHYNEEGHEILAEKIHETLEKTLSSEKLGFDPGF